MRSLALLGVVGALLVTETAQAEPLAVPPGFVGVMADGPLFSSPVVDLPHELDLMAGAGVESLRVAFYWDLAQPFAPGTAPPLGYEDVGGVPTSFARPDAIVAEAARRNLRMLPVVLRPPVWARADPGQLWSPPRRDTYSRYAAFLAALVHRYKPGGSFWAQRRPGAAAIGPGRSRTSQAAPPSGRSSRVCRRTPSSSTWPPAPSVMPTPAPRWCSPD